MLQQLLQHDDRQLVRLLSLARQAMLDDNAPMACSCLGTFCDQLEHRLRLEEEKVVEPFLLERPHCRELHQEYVQLRRCVRQLSEDLRLPLGAACESNLRQLENRLLEHFSRKAGELYPYLAELATLRRLVLDEFN